MSGEIGHCDKCEYYLETKVSTPSHPWSEGECRRYAPRPLTLKYDIDGEKEDYHAYWPRVIDSDYCGEWKAMIDDEIDEALK